MNCCCVRYPLGGGEARGGGPTVCLPRGGLTRRHLQAREGRSGNSARMNFVGPRNVLPRGSRNATRGREGGKATTIELHLEDSAASGIGVSTSSQSSGSRELDQPIQAMVPLTNDADGGTHGNGDRVVILRPVGRSSANQFHGFPVAVSRFSPPIRPPTRQEFVEPHPEHFAARPPRRRRRKSGPS